MGEELHHQWISSINASTWIPLRVQTARHCSLVPDKEPAPTLVWSKPMSSSHGLGPCSSPNYDLDYDLEETYLLVLQHWSAGNIGVHLNFLMFFRAALLPQHLWHLQLGNWSNKVFMWKQELQGIYFDLLWCWKRSFKGGETVLQGRLRAITDSHPWMCVCVWRLTSVTQRENKQWAVWWEDRKHNT